MSAEVIVRRYRGVALNWWTVRSPREQILIAGLCAVAVCAMYLSFVYAPIAAVRRDAIRDIRTYEALAAQLRVTGPALLGRAAALRQDSSTAVTGSAAEAGLSLRRIDPDGRRVRIVVEDAAFDAVVRWLDRLERERGLRLRELRIERRPSPGAVNAQVTLEQP